MFVFEPMVLAEVLAFTLPTSLISSFVPGTLIDRSYRTWPTTRASVCDKVRLNVKSLGR